MKVIITGATGMVGKGVLLVCLEDESVEKVLCIVRSSTGITHPKLKEVLHSDFFNLSPVEAELKGYDACFFCLGVTSLGLKEDQYRHLTYDLTLNFAAVVLAQNPGIQFNYVSGAGTDSTEKGRSMWARVKGKTENDLLKSGFKKAVMFRPGFIQPMRDIRSKTGWYQAMYNVLKVFYPLLKKMPKYVTDTDTLGRAMIRSVLKKDVKPVLESVDINELGVVSS
ncbi:MAG: epimerase [Bacteroidetes bacterium]|nr:epimerase [Bacteroidota bacterium]